MMRRSFTAVCRLCLFDLRRAWPLAATVAALEIWRAVALEAGLHQGPTEMGAAAAATTALWLDGGLWLLLGLTTAAVVQADHPTDDGACWRTRPIPPLLLGLAKAVSLGLLFVALPAAVDAVRLAAYGAPPVAMAVSSFQILRGRAWSSCRCGDWRWPRARCLASWPARRWSSPSAIACFRHVPARPALGLAHARPVVAETRRLVSCRRSRTGRRRIDTGMHPPSSSPARAWRSSSRSTRRAVVAALAAIAGAALLVAPTAWPATVRDAPASPALVAAIGERMTMPDPVRVPARWWVQYQGMNTTVNGRGPLPVSREPFGQPHVALAGADRGRTVPVEGWPQQTIGVSPIDVVPRSVPWPPQARPSEPMAFDDRAGRRDGGARAVIALGRRRHPPDRTSPDWTIPLVEGAAFRTDRFLLEIARVDTAGAAALVRLAVSRGPNGGRVAPLVFRPGRPARPRLPTLTYWGG